MLQYTDKSRKFSYLDTALATIEIDQDAKGCFAKVRSENDSRSYKVRVDEVLYTATFCECVSYFYSPLMNKHCKHTEIVDAYYVRIIGIFVRDDAEEIAARAEEANMVKLATYRRSIAADAYEVLAETKHVHCGGCHNVQGEGDGSRCKAGFYYWNGWWTEAMCQVRSSTRR